MKSSHTVKTLLATTAAAFITLPSMAAGSDTSKATGYTTIAAPANAVAYSDRHRMQLWTSEKRRLEAALKTGSTKANYLKMLADNGFTLTSINADKSDYLEYEVVKDTNTYEVQIDLDAAGNGKTIRIEPNIWRADTTKSVLRGNRMSEAPRYMAVNSAYSDRSRMTQWTSDMDKLEKALGTGKPLAAYTTDLQKMGYQITSTNDRDKDYVEVEIVKGQSTYEVQFDLDEAGKATKVDVTSNMWHSDATEKMLEKNRK